MMLFQGAWEILLCASFCVSVTVSAQTSEQEVVRLVNLERFNNGNLPPLKHVELLDQSSESHSQNMANRDFFAHCDLDTGESVGDRMTAVGYVGRSFWGENISAGQSTPASVMSGWMASSGHRANILSTDFNEIGVGYYTAASDSSDVRLDLTGDCAVDDIGGPFFHYWTQNFGSRFDVYPVVINREDLETDDSIVSLYVYGPGSAVEMRIRNETNAWLAWEPFSNDKTWILSDGGGIKTVEVQLRNSSGTVVSQQSDTIFSWACSVLTQTLDLAPQNITGTEIFEACEQINAGDGSGSFLIGPSANVTMRARKIVLAPGFSVQSGGRFTAITVPP